MRLAFFRPPVAGFHDPKPEVARLFGRQCSWVRRLRRVASCTVLDPLPDFGVRSAYFVFGNGFVGKGQLE